MRVITTQALRYGGKPYAVGAELDMPEKHVRLFIASKKVDIAPVRTVRADESATQAPDTGTTRRGRYRRRDMRADGDGA
ncbi:hypothetical protein [Paraburkholderia bannensis]|uniref:hypothetical protein n=1 Tax=Paraburkholderia bannensis TaxID=765414 RepID=UPI002AC36A4E|nr:hypothetical protein [Paraburkholderia bannensis]